jgi:proteasome lid subunit RPN8/RPN11
LNAESFPGPTRRRPGPAPASLTLRLPATLQAIIVAHCTRTLPDEGCGLLLGHRQGTQGSVVEVLPARNTRASPQHYEIEPETVLAADQRARAQGQLLLGAWHSHPGGMPVPSATDRAEAWPDWCYVIVGLADPAHPELRAWRLVGEDFIEDTLEIE